MCRFTTLRDTLFISKHRTLKDLNRKTTHKNYLGVGQICNYGKPSLFRKLLKTYGYKKAKEIQNRAVKRGNSIHKKLRKTNKSLFEKDLGYSVASEVLVIGKPFPNLPEVQGTIDDIRFNPYLRSYSIVEYKTKTSYKTWKQHRDEVLPYYKMKMCAYYLLASLMYPEVYIEQLGLIIVFPKDLSILIDVSEEEKIKYMHEFFKNATNFLKW